MSVYKYFQIQPLLFTFVSKIIYYLHFVIEKTAAGCLNFIGQIRFALLIHSLITRKRSFLMGLNKKISTPAR